MTIFVMCKMTPISVRLNFKNFILRSCAVLELLRKVPPPSGEIGLSDIRIEEGSQLYEIIGVVRVLLKAHPESIIY